MPELEELSDEELRRRAREAGVVRPERLGRDELIRLVARAEEAGPFEDDDDFGQVVSRQPDD